MLFPLIVRSVGAYNYGLWLATGEAISYVLLGDLGVFAVLPWLVAGRIGANDFDSLRKLLANAITIGSIIGGLLLVFCFVALSLNPSQFGIPATVWNVIFFPTILLLGLNGLGYPFRAFSALLIGAQDVLFLGLLSALQSVLLLILTVVMIVSDSGIPGLALATGLPPLLVSVIAFLRTLWKHPYTLRGMSQPDFSGCLTLFREGFGAWLSGLGVRMMAASNGIILASVGKPEWATVYASSGKISQILSPMCSTIPDNGLVGVSHVHASNDGERTRRSVVCLVLLYTIIPSFAAIALLVANPAFVSWWIGPELYAGHYVNILTAISVVIAGVAGGLLKLVSVVGLRQTVGWSTVVAGVSYALLGYILVRWHGLVGLAEATLCVWLGILFPIGTYLIFKVYEVRLSDFMAVGAGRWLCITLAFIVIASVIGIQLAHFPFLAFTASLACIGIYGLLLRPTLALAPWPANVRHWLCRLRVIPDLTCP